MKSILCAVSSFWWSVGDKNHRTGVRMNNQYLQFVREQLIIATADLSGATKGQLEARRRMPCLIPDVTGEKNPVPR